MKENHLKNDLLERLLTGAAEEAERIAAAEHLCTCDRCLARFDRLLTDDKLLQPKLSIAERVRRELSKRNTSTVLSRITAAVAAVVLAMTFWMTDVFDRLVPKSTDKPIDLPVQSASLSDGLSSFFYDLSDRLSDLTLTDPAGDDAEQQNKES